jgi:ubiquinone/menaquinone biosynthesis C-methylase UbiE
MCAKIGVVAPSQHDDLVRRSFEQQVSLFSGPDSLFAKRIPGPQSWIEPLEPHMTVLDVACGAGHAADPLAPHVRQVVGVDLTRALLDLGAGRLREAGIENVLLQEGNAEALPFVDESFDIVFCRAALHHIGDPERAVAEMMRVCRVGGRVVLMDLLAPSTDESVRTRFDDVHRRIDPSHRRAFTEVEVANLLPGGTDALVHAETSELRFPVDVAFTEQSQQDHVLAELRADAGGTGPATGFAPVEEDGKIVVSFVTCIVHTQR